MDKKDALKIAKKFASLLMANYDCKMIFLFGSYVKGTNHEESDIDIAVILREFENPINMQLELMRLRRKIDSRIEPHPFREIDFNMMNPVAYEILKHGQRINISNTDN
ncbi:MAG: nucleotidyltransferase domain-containing protein [Proteobacteria bacterium]|nr:nucleotidyltransferase domain-containing protein [Pseudomonadota bacterium]